MSLDHRNDKVKICNNPPHFPFDDTPFRLSMGLLKVPIKEWFEIFDLSERELQMKEKRRLLSDYPNNIFMADPSSFIASTEVLNLMVEHLPAVRPDLYSRGRNTIKLRAHSKFNEEIWSTNLKTNETHPLDLAARLVQEDLIIMLPPKSNKKHISKGWWLAAGSVSFPSRWSLKEKFGLPMDIIHAPVPFYKEQIQDTVDTFFNAMPYDEIYARRNWSLYDNSTLRHDGSKQSSDMIKKSITSSNAGDRLWLRVERQTLRKLKETGAILFTIRIHLRQLKHVVSFDGIADRLSKALLALPPEMHEYKETSSFADSTQAYLNMF
jgi:dimethylamine monooxygenase subunit A